MDMKNQQNFKSAMEKYSWALKEDFIEEYHLDTEEVDIVRVFEGAISEISAKMDLLTELAPRTCEDICEKYIIASINRNLDSAELMASDAIESIYSVAFELNFSNKLDAFESVREAFSIYQKGLLPGEISKRLGDIEFRMPILMANSALSALGPEKIDAIKKDLDRAKNDVKLLNSTIESQGQIIKKLEASLNALEEKEGFVSLNNGFKDLSERKQDELKSKKSTRTKLELLIFVPLAIEFFYVIFYRDEIAKNPTQLLISVPVLTSVFVLIYLFRLAYREEDSVRSQILQIDLRMSLIKFIEKYSSYAKDKKTTTAGSELEKFENIIFSNISPNDEKIPTTFDGVDGLTSLVKAIKGKD